jgi:(p)ppGpp synthase/HD superfamily hydrolase
MVMDAINLGARAFAGMKDKTGREPAYLHSLRVEKLVAKTGAGEIAQAAALLHDVVEDTRVTVSDIRTAFVEHPSDKVEKMINVVLSVTRGYVNRITKEMVFTPPSPDLVCDCRSRKCVVPSHYYDKETYRNFVMRSKANTLGRIVKIADITDNSSAQRIEGLSEEEKGIVEERYIPALAFLRDDKAKEYFTPKQLARLCQWCSQPLSAHTGDERKCPGKMLFHDPQRCTYKGVRA